ncbi:MAG TPA: acyltransferase family protein [Frankiaceae bacterium]
MGARTGDGRGGRPLPAGRHRARPTPRSFRTDVQGLRAVAVLAVVLYHAGVPGLRGGYVGVDVFYVISGFLITGLLWRPLGAGRRLSLATFYARRARRLLPAAALVLTVTVVVAALVLPPLAVPGVARDAAAAALYVANYRFAAQGTDYLAAAGPPSPVQHFWSLGVEEQFYLVWPALLLLAVAATRGRRSRWSALAVVLAVGALSLVLSIRLTTLSQPWAFYSLPSRAWELAAGGTVALLAPELRRAPALAAALLGWVGLGALAGAVLAFGPTTPFPGHAAVLPVAGAALVIAAGTARPLRGPRVLLDRRALQEVGRLSYGWYLWHWPVLVLGAVVLGHGPLTTAGLVLLSLLLAGLTWRLVEDPVRRAPVLVRSSRRSLSLGAALTVTGLVVAVVAVWVVPPPQGTGAAVAAPAPAVATGRAAPAAHPSAAPDPLATAQAALAGAVAAGPATQVVPSNLTPSLARAHRDLQEPFLDGCDLSFTAAASPPCLFGDTAGSAAMVAFGDSHAAQWFPALDAVANGRQWRFENLTKATCPPLDLPIHSPDLRREFTECERWRAATVQRIAAERPALVVVDMARHYGPEYDFTVYSPPWVTALHDLVARLRAMGSHVLVFGPVAKPPSDSPTCLSAHLSDVPACTRPTAQEVDAAGAAAERAATQAAGGTYVDVVPWVCAPDRCPAVVGNMLVYRDDNHLTQTYAQWLTPVVTAAVDEALTAPPRS